MEFLAWSILLICTLLGMLGTVLPGPGLPLLVIGAIAHKFILPTYLSYWGLGVLFFFCTASLGVDLVASLYGAKKWGKASRTGLMGAGIGGLVGLFFGPLGLLLGPLLGAFIGELMELRTFKESLTSAIGTGLGLGVAALTRVALGVLCIITLIIDLAV